MFVKYFVSTVKRHPKRRGDPMAAPERVQEGGGFTEKDVPDETIITGPPGHVFRRLYREELAFRVL